MGLFDKKKPGKSPAELKLEEIINRVFPGTLIESQQDDGTYRWALREESALIEAWINTDFGDTDFPIVSVSSPVVLGARDDDKLFRFLIETGDQSIFTKWMVFPGDDKGTVNVICVMNLALNTLVDEVLGQAIIAVAETANTLDDEIMKRFGGQRAQEIFGWQD